MYYIFSPHTHAGGDISSTGNRIRPAEDLFIGAIGNHTAEGVDRVTRRRSNNGDSVEQRESGVIGEAQPAISGDTPSEALPPLGALRGRTTRHSGSSAESLHTTSNSSTAPRRKNRGTKPACGK